MIISVFLYLPKVALLLVIWPVLETILWTLEKNVCSAFFEQNVQQISIKFISSVMTFNSDVSFPLTLSIGKIGVLNQYTNIVVLLVCVLILVVFACEMVCIVFGVHFKSNSFTLKQDQGLTVICQTQLTPHGKSYLEEWMGVG